MNGTDQLDTFETALLAELRREVAEHPAPAPAAGRQPRRRLKLVAAGAVAAAAAIVAAVGLSGGGPIASPAFAVDANPDGSLTIVIHELDDSGGLEAALADHGMDATVHFEAMGDGQIPDEPEVDGAYGASHESCGIGNGPGPVMLVPGRGQYDSSDYVLRIRAGSPLFDRPFVLDVGGPGSFSIAYESSEPGKYCYFGQSQIFEAPASGTGEFHLG